jgi:hypothetical protein
MLDIIESLASVFLIPDLSSIIGDYTWSCQSYFFMHESSNSSGFRTRDIDVLNNLVEGFIVIKSNLAKMYINDIPNNEMCCIAFLDDKNYFITRNGIPARDFTWADCIYPNADVRLNTFELPVLRKFVPQLDNVEIPNFYSHRVKDRSLELYNNHTSCFYIDMIL